VGIRETLNENRSVTVGATIGIIVLTIIWVIWYSVGGNSAAAAGGKAFYTDDDGQTYFADDATKIAPFDHGGKPANLAFVWRCGDSGKPFVAYMLRYTDDGKKLRENAMKNKNVDPAAIEMTQNQMEVKVGPNQPKKPQGWFKMSDTAHAGPIQQVTCPDGSSNNLQAVDPNS
jgi:hypothetical protein